MRIALLACCVSVLTACGGGGSETPQNNVSINSGAAVEADNAADADERGTQTAENTVAEDADAQESSEEAAKQDFTIINNTGQTVVALNVSPSNEEQWGPDILGRDMLRNGEQGDIQFDRKRDECEWDIRVAYEDEDIKDWRGVNLCQTATITLTP